MRPSEIKDGIYKSRKNFTVAKMIHGKNYRFGTYSTEELAKEVEEWLKTVNYDVDEWKKSKYYNMRNISGASPEKKGKGSIVKARNYYGVFLGIKHKKQYFGGYETEELAEEVRQWCIEHDWDYEEWKKSKYYNMSADHRHTSKNYWREENPTMNKKNTSGHTGVYWCKTHKRWGAEIIISYTKIEKKFYSKSAAIEFRKQLEIQGREFNKEWDENRIKKQIDYIYQDIKNTPEEKQAEKIAKFPDQMIGQKIGEYTVEDYEKEGNDIIYSVRNDQGVDKVLTLEEILKEL